MQSVSQQSNAARRGFSLLELLVVLMILVAVAGLSLPAMRGALDRGRLTAAARDIQAALGKARSLSIREATAVHFRFQQGGSRYIIEKARPSQGATIVVMDDAGALSQSPSGLLSESGSQNMGSPTVAAQEEPLVLREGTLPPGVTFAANSGAADSITGGADSPNQMAASSEPVSVAANPAWSLPIVFFPSGRTRNQMLRLHGQREFVVDITLRGLTSTCSYSAPTKLSVNSVAMLRDPNAAATNSSGTERSDRVGMTSRQTDQGALP